MTAAPRCTTKGQARVPGQLDATEQLTSHCGGGVSDKARGLAHPRSREALMGRRRVTAVSGLSAAHKRTGRLNARAIMSLGVRFVGVPQNSCRLSMSMRENHVRAGAYGIFCQPNTKATRKATLYSLHSETNTRRQRRHMAPAGRRLAQSAPLKCMRRRHFKVPHNVTASTRALALVETVPRTRGADEGGEADQEPKGRSETPELESVRDEAM